MSNNENFSDKTSDIHSVPTVQIPNIHSLRIVQIPYGDTLFPMCVNTGVGPHEHLNDFLITRKNHVSYFNTDYVKYKKLTQQSLMNIASHMRTFMNILAELNKHYLFVTGTDITTILKTYRSHGRSENTLEQYLNTWRLFYFYLTTERIEHCVHDLPAKVPTIVNKTDAEKEDDPFSYAKDNKKVVMVDECIEKNRKNDYSNYANQVLSLNEMDSLLEELAKIDIVYAVMATIQFHTLLRISEIVNEFPYKKNKLNPHWKTLARMKQLNLTEQKFNFIGKGKDRKIYVELADMEIIFNYYLSLKEQGDITNYTLRHNLFLTKYLNSKLGKKSHFTEDSDVLWLTKGGHPVSIGMYQDAFRRSSEQLYAKNIAHNVRIRPHSMRHSGATQALWAYQESEGVDLTYGNRLAIQTFLQRKLGHCNMETTLIYIYTAQSKLISKISLNVMKKTRGRFDKILKDNIILKKGLEIGEKMYSSHP